jgi:hypothetical protein
MFDVFLTTVNAVVPIILLILLGYFLKRIKFLNQNFIKMGNTFVFKVCIPCMLFINIYDKMDSFADIRWDVVLYAVVAICVIFVLGLVTAVLTTKQADRRGVILQCTFRSNFAIIGLTLVERLNGDTSVAGIISAFSIPLFNVLAVISLSLFVNDDETIQTVDENGNVVVHKLSKGAKFWKSTKKILKGIVTNPLIIGVVLGLVFVAIREIQIAAGWTRVITDGDTLKTVAYFRFSDQLKFLYTAVKDLKSIASPLALVILGGQFEFSAVKGMTKEIVVATVWRIILAPLLAIGCAVLISNYTNLFTFDYTVYPTFIALFGTPVAVSSAIMAGAMKNDEQLATQLVVWTSICSIVTIFVMVFLLITFGLIVV